MKTENKFSVFSCYGILAIVAKVVKKSNLWDLVFWLVIVQSIHTTLLLFFSSSFFFLSSSDNSTTNGPFFPSSFFLLQSHSTGNGFYFLFLLAGFFFLSFSFLFSFSFSFFLSSSNSLHHVHRSNTQTQTHKHKPTTMAEDWFFIALNGSGLLNKRFSDPSLVNCLLGLDNDGVVGSMGWDFWLMDFGLFLGFVISITEQKINWKSELLSFCLWLSVSLWVLWWVAMLPFCAIPVGGLHHFAKN